MTKLDPPENDVRWITPDREADAGKLFKVVASTSAGDREYLWNSEPAYRIGRSEGGIPDAEILLRTIGMLISCVRDRWIVLLGDQIFHMHEDSLSLLVEEDFINWRHLRHVR